MITKTSKLDIHGFSITIEELTTEITEQKKCAICGDSKRFLGGPGMVLFDPIIRPYGYTLWIPYKPSEIKYVDSIKCLKKVLKQIPKNEIIFKLGLFTDV